MRIRALLFIPAFTTAALVVGANSASGATLFTTTGHQTRVTLGATADATSQGPVNFTSGALVNTCPHITLHLRVVENTHHRTSLDVYASTFATCSPFPYNGTHVPPWRLTITGNPTMIGAFTSYPATLDNVAYDLSGTGAPGPFTGNLEGLTVTQPTTATSPICVDANNAGTATHPVLGTATIDAKFCLTGAAASWSLT